MLQEVTRIASLKNCRRSVIPPERVRRILVRATNWVGDMVMCLPALEALGEHFPAAHITVLARPWVAALLREHPAVDQILLFEARDGFGPRQRERLRQVRSLQRGRFDLAVLFQNAFEAALLAWLGRVPLRLGFDTDGRGWLLTHKVRRAPEIMRRHQVEYYLELVRAAGWIGDGGEPRLFLAADDRRAAAAWLARNGIGVGTVVFGLSPGAMYGSAKRWPAERFAAVGDRAAAQWGARVLIFGSGKEEPVCERVSAGMQRPHLNLCGQTSLGVAAALIERCQAFVTNDSGLMHIAAALGVPTVAVFGSTDPVATGPRGLRARIVRHDYDCAPCLKSDCPGQHGCMLSIYPEEVWRAVEELAGSVVDRECS